MDQSELDALYQEYLGRPADPSGIATWSSQDPNAVVAGILGSPEYQASHPSGGGDGGGGGGGAPFVDNMQPITDPSSGDTQYQYQDSSGGTVTVDSSGNPVGYTPGQSWYQQQYQAHPDAIRSGYRNQQYLATGPLDQTYTVNGKQVPITNAYEYQVDPNTKALTNTPVYREQSSGGFGNWMAENGWMLPLIMAGGVAGAEFLPGLLGSEVGMVDAAGNIIGAGAEGAAVGAGAGTGAGSSFLEQLAATQAAEDAAAGAAYPAGSVPTGAGLSGNVYGATGLDAILAEAGLSGLTGADLLKYGIPLGNLASRLTGGSGAASSLLGGLSGNTRPASALTGTTSGGYGSAINNYGSPKGTFVHGQQVAIPGMTPYSEPAQVANQQPYFNPQTLQEIQQAKNGGIIHKAGGGDLPMQEVRMRGRQFTMHQPHSGLSLVPRFAPGGSVPEGHEPTFFSPGGLASMENTYVKGDGDGTSDSVAAMLADGEFVVPADVVSKLGNGSNDAGAKVLDNFLVTIREHAQKHDPKELPPDSKGPLAYLLDAKKKASA